MEEKRTPVKIIQRSSAIIGQYFCGLTYEESKRLIEELSKEVESIFQEPNF
jgi:sulfite reductase beta subunit-like hemoprotein